MKNCNSAAECAVMKNDFGKLLAYVKQLEADATQLKSDAQELYLLLEKIRDRMPHIVQINIDDTLKSWREKHGG